ncbi:hypothetical protein BDA99DRAFT_541906 [Phascolomyces articulosus]|uniref:Uncharacterized protein n=1 Tax=Phascolomyces articulosus TaxID=60185 RepID=A0AAD5P9I4_9FUNG|nr:hypothetical protein BDA99DRAFT_541906 [Phascolomyces articulosus]
MNRHDALTINNRRRRILFNNNGRFVQFLKKQFTRSRRIFTMTNLKRITGTSANNDRHQYQHQHDRLERRQQQQQQSDPTPRWTMITININGVGDLTTYQINGVLLCALAVVPLLFFAFYQFGRLLGILEIIFFGVDDILRTTCYSITRIFTRFFS